MRQEAKEYPSFPLGNRLYIRLGLYSRFMRRVRRRAVDRGKDTCQLHIVYQKARCRR